MANKSSKQSTPSNVADELERVITHLDTLYEQGLQCAHPDTHIIVTDGEYDGLRRQLKQLRPDSKLFATATASQLVTAANKVVHDPPMTSIEKASHENIKTQEEQLFKWLLKTVESAPESTLGGPRQTAKGKTYKGEPVQYPKSYFYQSYKLDGVAIAIYYENGKLVRAGLRPRDGINGEDVTEQVKFVSGVPVELPLKVTCSVRGELVCKLPDFLKVQKALSRSGEKLRANPRNHTAGGIRQFKDPKKPNGCG